MDVIRNAYTTQIRPYRDSDEEVTIRWYFTDDDRPLMPFPTAFGRSEWRRNEADPGIGEVLQAPTWNRGDDLLRLPGTTFCGTREQWNFGALSSDPLPTIDPASGLPTCCGQQRRALAECSTGRAITTEAQQPSGNGVVCGCCDDSLPTTLKLTLFDAGNGGCWDGREYLIVRNQGPVPFTWGVIDFAGIPGCVTPCPEVWAWMRCSGEFAFLGVSAVDQQSGFGGEMFEYGSFSFSCDPLEITWQNIRVNQDPFLLTKLCSDQLFGDVFLDAVITLP